MPDLLNADILRERLNMDMPGAIAPRQPEAEPEAGDGREHKKGKGEKKGAADILAANQDTVVVPERITEVATYMRDVLGYAFLSDMVAVDYLDAGIFELVYLFYHPEGGSSLVIKTQVPRDQPDIPSLTPIWPGADLLEREAFDLFGINFIGHPYQKRIYMWDELEVYPMRRDFPKQGDKYLDEE